jgi:hypothetical protein
LLTFEGKVDRPENADEGKKVVEPECLGAEEEQGKNNEY